MKITKPRKAEGARCNTWIVDCEGFMFDGKRIVPRTLTVRFTSDNHETLSITDENQDLQFSVNFRKVEQMINLARKEFKKN